MSRIHKGFHRIGVVLAVPVLALSLGWAAMEWNSNRKAVALTHAKNAALERAHQRMVEEKQKAILAGTANLFDEFDPNRNFSPLDPPSADYTLQVLFAAAAIALYAASRALGWVISGFVEPKN